MGIKLLMKRTYSFILFDPNGVINKRESSGKIEKASWVACQ